MVTVYGTFKPKECLRTIQNLFTHPKYTALRIGMKAYIKLMCYCHLAGEQEITGIGRIKDGEIVDFKIPYQVVTGTTADATDDDIIDLMREIPIDEISEWELDWHSHCDMQAFISQTDEKNYELMSMAKGGKQFPILVINKKGDVCCKQFIHAGKVTTINFILEKSELENSELTEIYNQCKQEVAERVSLKPIPLTYSKAPWYEKSKKNELTDFGDDTAEDDNGYSDNLTIDRIDNDSNYYPNNCKWSTRFEQQRNTRLQKNNKSGVRGVFWDNTNLKWVAKIGVNNKSISLGHYINKEDAIKARKKGELEYWGGKK